MTARGAQRLDINQELEKYTGVSCAQRLLMPDLVSGSAIDFVQQVSALRSADADAVTIRERRRRTCTGATFLIQVES